MDSKLAVLLMVGLGILAIGGFGLLEIRFLDWWETRKKQRQD